MRVHIQQANFTERNTKPTCFSVCSIRGQVLKPGVQENGASPTINSNIKTPILHKGFFWTQNRSTERGKQGKKKPDST